MSVELCVLRLPTLSAGMDVRMRIDEGRQCFDHPTYRGSRRRPVTGALVALPPQIGQVARRTACGAGAPVRAEPAPIVRYRQAGVAGLGTSCDFGSGCRKGDSRSKGRVPPLR